MAKIVGNKIVETENFERIHEQGFGAIKDGELLLTPLDALYLLEEKKIEVKKGRIKLDFEKLLAFLEKKGEKQIKDYYSVFRDLRKRGYVCRYDLKNSGWLRVYERGARPTDRPSKYVLRVMDAKTGMPQLLELLAQAHSFRRQLLLALVENGRITYFKFDNKIL
ncbi:MAG: hypothetical protein NT157_04660 [Candidatus Micrarchaeota archaeon]|nr:hypothetical protein [Candidatus Micrarchaeota archaeon]